jgi:hypothetical protein
MSRFLNHSFATLVCGVPTPVGASHHPRLEAWYQTRGCRAAPASPRTPSATHKPLMRNRFEIEFEKGAEERRPRGFFAEEPLEPSERRERMMFARAWLDWILSKGPRPAREVLSLAKLEGIPVRGLRRAKKFLGVRSYKFGGKQGGHGAVWVWFAAVSKSARMSED